MTTDSQGKINGQWLNSLSMVVTKTSGWVSKKHHRVLCLLHQYLAVQVDWKGSHNVTQTWKTWSWVYQFMGSRVGAVVRVLAFHQCVPGSIPRTRRHMWAEFVGSLLCFERFFSGYSGFPLSSKTNIWFDLIWWKNCKGFRIVRRIWKRTLNLRGINKYYYCYYYYYYYYYYYTTCTQFGTVDFVQALNAPWRKGYRCKCTYVY